MNHELLEQSWNELVDFQDAIADTYYERLTLAYPQYEAVLEELPMQNQRESLPQILEMVTWMHPQDDDAIPFIGKMAADLEAAKMELDDLETFREVMVSVIDDFGRRHVSGWSNDHRDAWDDAFEITLIPMLLSSMDKAA
jgi:hypothetical protein